MRLLRRWFGRVLGVPAGFWVAPSATGVLIVPASLVNRAGPPPESWVHLRDRDTLERFLADLAGHGVEPR